MRVTTAFSRLLRLRGVWVQEVGFEPDRVVVEVALCRKRLVCPLCDPRHGRARTRVRRHLDLGVWRLEVHCRRRRLWCPRHGARTEGVPFARPGSEFTRDFECLVAWLATRTDKTTIKRMLRVDWDTVGRIIKRVCADELDPDRLEHLYDIGIDGQLEAPAQLPHARRRPRSREDRVGLRGRGREGRRLLLRRIDPEIAAVSPPPRPSDAASARRPASRRSAIAPPSSGRSRWT